MRKLCLVLALLVTATLAGAQPLPTPEAGRRVALVVGIGGYEHAGRLAATPNDARTMAQTLAGFGFTLVGGGPLVDVDKRGFDAAIQEFGRLAQGADIALFYYSGHGMQYQGTNWLVPRDAPPLGRPETIEFAHVDAGAVLRQFSAVRPRLGIMVLDACRSDPYRPSETRDTVSQGLAPMRAPRGTVIAYATQPGNTSLDGGAADRISPYTRALIEAMRTPGLSLFEMFNQASLHAISYSNGHQEPWLALSPIDGDFYFVPRGAQPPVLAALPGSGSMAVPPGPTPAGNDQPPQRPAQDPNFVLVNLSGRTVRTVKASLASDNDWGRDRLDGNQLGQAQRLPLDFPRNRGCAVDVRVEFADGTVAAEFRGLDTCRFSAMVLTPERRLLPANPNVRVVNGTGRPIADLRASLATERDWGGNRLPQGRVLAPGERLELALPQGVSCDIDLRVSFAGGGEPRELRRQDTCAVAEYALK
jgi:hypothetical protein